MISKGLKPSNRSLRKVISSPCDAGDLQKALELSQEMRFRGWIHDSAIQTSIVESLLLCGKVQEAETFLEWMGEESLTLLSTMITLLSFFASMEDLTRQFIL